MKHLLIIILMLFVFSNCKDENQNCCADNSQEGVRREVVTLYYNYDWQNNGNPFRECEFFIRSAKGEQFVYNKDEIDRVIDFQDTASGVYQVEMSFKVIAYYGLCRMDYMPTPIIEILSCCKVEVLEGVGL